MIFLVKTVKWVQLKPQTWCLANNGSESFKFLWLGKCLFANFDCLILTIIPVDILRYIFELWVELDVVKANRQLRIFILLTLFQ